MRTTYVLQQQPTISSANLIRQEAFLLLILRFSARSAAEIATQVAFGVVGLRLTAACGGQE